MSKPSLSLQESEAAVVQAAATIYSAYIRAGRVTDGGEKEWMQRSIQEAIWIAKTTDEGIMSDDELG